jgi:predicted O-methyltransferase YrrM
MDERHSIVLPVWCSMSTASEIALHFPIESQSSDRDKEFLLAAKRMIGEVAPGYDYLEIGSFLGGSLAPFLVDPACASILSIDERGKTLPDERGALFDYAGITTQSMIDRLHLAGLDTTKLTTHDGPIDTMTVPERRFDLAFIDGEHTDQACFRDFLWALPMMKPNSVVLFHDSSLIYKAIRLIELYLRKEGRPFVFLKHGNSEMSAIFLGDFTRLDLGRYFEAGEDRDEFYASSEVTVLDHSIRNRVRSGPGEAPLQDFIIDPPKAVKAYF